MSRRKNLQDFLSHSEFLNGSNLKVFFPRLILANNWIISNRPLEHESQFIFLYFMAQFKHIHLLKVDFFISLQSPKETFFSHSLDFSSNRSPFSPERVSKYIPLKTTQ